MIPKVGLGNRESIFGEADNAAGGKSDPLYSVKVQYLGKPRERPEKARFAGGTFPISTSINTSSSGDHATILKGDVVIGWLLQTSEVPPS